MTRYYVHYESVSLPYKGMPGEIIHMIMPVETKTEAQAIARCKLDRPGSFGHWVNRLANEAA